MKLSELQKNNYAIDYFGLRLIVPKGYRWLATDLTGEVFAYKKKPNQGIDEWDSQWDKSLIHELFDEIDDWKESLVEIELSLDEKIEAALASCDQKTIEYFGKKLVIPDFANYIAMDKCGAVYVYEIKPGTWDSSWAAGGKCHLILRTNTTIKNWKDTLREVSK